MATKRVVLGFWGVAALIGVLSQSALGGSFTWTGDVGTQEWFDYRVYDSYQDAEGYWHDSYINNWGSIWGWDNDPPLEYPNDAGDDVAIGPGWVVQAAYPYGASAGDVTVAGTVFGDVSCADLTVESTGRVDGAFVDVVGTARIAGTVSGFWRLTCQDLTVESTGQVDGEYVDVVGTARIAGTVSGFLHLTCQDLTVESTGQVDGEYVGVVGTASIAGAVTVSAPWGLICQDLTVESTGQVSSASVTGPAITNDGLIGGLELNGPLTVSGSGTIRLADSYAGVEGAVGSTLTNEAGHTIEGYGDIRVPLVNYGLVQGNVDGQTLFLWDDGGGGSTTNNGTIKASNNGTLAIEYLYFNVTQSSDGIIVADDGCVRIDATITGGTITTVGTGYIDPACTLGYVHTGGSWGRRVLVASGWRTALSTPGIGIWTG